MRGSFSIFKDAAGIWIEDKYIPIFQSIINLISSIILVKLIGLTGVFIGTILSSFVLWFYSYPKFVYKKLFDKNISLYVKELIEHILIFLIIIFISYILNSYYNNLLITIIICILLPNIVLVILYKNKEEYLYYKKLILCKIKK